eukprot:scaffold34509_cov84-Phaeocystis_antarctica.AAC.1
MLSRAVPYADGAAHNQHNQHSGSNGAFGSGATEPFGSAQPHSGGGAQAPSSGSTEHLTAGGAQAPSSGSTEPLSGSGAQAPSSGSTEPLSAGGAQAPSSGSTEPLTAGFAAAVATGGLLSPEGASPPDSDLSAQIAVQLRKDEIRAARGRASQPLSAARLSPAKRSGGRRATAAEKENSPSPNNVRQSAMGVKSPAGRQALGRAAASRRSPRGTPRSGHGPPPPSPLGIGAPRGLASRGVASGCG